MKLSIITINRNNADGLRKTMQSVLSQTYRDFEYIVVDGASTDNSVQTIKDCINYVEERYDVKWISEPDNGIYEAMNKGLKMARGEYTLMLNSGDYLVDEHVIEYIIPELHTEDMIQGNLIEDLPIGVVRDRGYGKSDISFINVLDGCFLHKATFIRLDAMEKYGYYDASYKKSADTYFFITALGLGNASFRYVDIDIANFDTNGISSMRDPKWRQIGNEENARWYGEHISNRLKDLYLTAPKKIRLYDTLHRHKWIWYIAMLLVRVSEWIYPTPPEIKKEIIK